MTTTSHSRTTRQPVRIWNIVLGWSLTVLLSSHATAQDTGDDTLAQSAMASFSRMVGGEWMMTAASGTSMCDTWHWGPGKRSFRVVTEGVAADGSPWNALEVVYWHPGLKEVCRLSMHPDVPGIGRGVGEGTVRFNHDTAISSVDLFQSRGPRKLRLRSVFTGPDKYVAALSEATGSDHFTPLAAWDYSRVNPNTTKRPPIPESEQQPARELSGFSALLGSWHVDGLPDWPADSKMQSSVVFVPLAEYIHSRTLVLSDTGGDMHVLETYIYHHTKTNTVRCLALSSSGGVYEGDVTVYPDSVLLFELKCHDADQSSARSVRIDFKQDGTLRLRAWAAADAERRLLLDVQPRSRKSNTE